MLKRSAGGAPLGACPGYFALQQHVRTTYSDAKFFSRLAGNLVPTSSSIVFFVRTNHRTIQHDQQVHYTARVRPKQQPHSTVQPPNHDQPALWRAHMLVAVAPVRQAGPGARGMNAAAEATAAEKAATRSMAAADGERGGQEFSSFQGGWVGTSFHSYASKCRHNKARDYPTPSKYCQHPPVRPLHHRWFKTSLLKSFGWVVLQARSGSYDRYWCAKIKLPVSRESEFESGRVRSAAGSHEALRSHPGPRGQAPLCQLSSYCFNDYP
eukprot:758617-Hanusia_phi.AAC.9